MENKKPSVDDDLRELLSNLVIGRDDDDEQGLVEGELKVSGDSVYFNDDDNDGDNDGDDDGINVVLPFPAGTILRIIAKVIDVNNEEVPVAGVEIPVFAQIGKMTSGGCVGGNHLCGISNAKDKFRIIDVDDAEIVAALCGIDIDDFDTWEAIRILPNMTPIKRLEF